MALLEKQKFPRRVEKTHSDSEPLYNSYVEPLRKSGVEHVMSPPGRHDKNGVVERKVQTLVWNAHAAFVTGGDPPKTDFKHALVHILYIDNHTPSKANPNSMSPEEVFLGRRLPKSKLIAQGVLFQLCHFKMGDSWVAGVFLGIDEAHQSYKVRSLKTSRMIHTVSLKFTKEFPYRPQRVLPAWPGESFTRPRLVLEQEIKDRELAIAQGQPIHSNPNPPPPEPLQDGQPPAPRRSARGFQPSAQYQHNLLQNGNLGGFMPSAQQLDAIAAQNQPAHLNMAMRPASASKPRPPDPTSLKEAEKEPDFHSFWLPGILREYEKHDARKTTKFVPRSSVPKGSRIFKHNLVLKRKYSDPTPENPHGELIEPGKARLTIAAYTKSLKEGVDYSQKYAPTVRQASIRTILAIVAHEDLELCKFDIETFFLWGDLTTANSKPVYMEVPPYFPVPQEFKEEDHVLQLLKSVYGLPQAHFCSHRELQECLVTAGKMRCLDSVDSCVFEYRDNGARIILGAHVDDMLCGANPAGIDLMKRILAKKFKFTIEMNPTCYLGIQIERDRPAPIAGSRSTRRSTSSRNSPNSRWTRQIP